MSRTFSFSVYGKIVAQARPRATSRGGHVHMYDKEKCVEFKERVAVTARNAMTEVEFPFITNDMAQQGIEVYIQAMFPIPKRYTNKQRSSIFTGSLGYIKKPDVDNIAKGVMDALTGVVWEDDKMVTSLSVEKSYRTPLIDNISDEYITVVVTY